MGIRAAMGRLFDRNNPDLRALNLAILVTLLAAAGFSAALLLRAGGPSHPLLSSSALAGS